MEYDINHNHQQIVVADQFQSCWKMYTQYAWGYDELDPVNKCAAPSTLHFSSTLVASMSTTLVMNHSSYFLAMNEWVIANMRYDINIDIDWYETSYKILEGMLSAYSLTGRKRLLSEIQSFSKILLRIGSSTNTTLPPVFINLARQRAISPQPTQVALSKLAMATLSWSIIARILQDNETIAFSLRLRETLLNLDSGLIPAFIFLNDGKPNPHGKHISLNTNSVRYYDTLLKLWILDGAPSPPMSNAPYRRFTESMKTVLQQFVVKSQIGSHENLYLVEITPSGDRHYVMEEALCAISGTLALHTLFTSDARQRLETASERMTYMNFSEKLAKICFRLSLIRVSGLIPHRVTYSVQSDVLHALNNEKSTDINDLSSQVIETFFLLHRATGHDHYVQWGWRMLTNMRRSSVAGLCLSATRQANDMTIELLNRTPAHFMGATLKYFYLLFASKEALYNPKEYLFTAFGHLFPLKNTAFVL